MTLFDTVFNYPVAEEISSDLKSKTIKDFLTFATKDIPTICITTDLVPKYKNIMDNLNINHQLCIFHFMQEVTRLRKKELKKIKDDEVEEELIRRECKEMQDIFRAKTLNECINRYIYFIENLDNDREYICKFVEKNLKKNFLNLIQFYFDPFIDKTSNKSENYFKQTDPDQIKKKYKTFGGLIDFLYLKMEYMTEKLLRELDEKYLTNF